MKIRFWGTRGSLPVAATADVIQQKIAAALHHASGTQFKTEDDALAWARSNLPFAVAGGYGGHTSCVEISTGAGHPDDYILCDAGSGLRAFAQEIMTVRGAAPAHYHLMFSHLHWDHIMGFPFFTPAFIPGNRVTIYGVHAELEAALKRQQEEPSFPVDFSIFNADIDFVTLAPDTPREVAGVTVTPTLQLHGGDSYGYRFESAGKSVIYSTDAEHKLENADDTQRTVEFFANADAVVFDAMYALADVMSVKEDWGHSSNLIGVELCQRAGVKQLLMTHHEPIFDDQQIEQILLETRRYEELTRAGRPPLRVSAAYDGMEYDC